MEACRPNAPAAHRLQSKPHPWPPLAATPPPGGLIKGFRQGTIYCTPTTAALVRLKIKVAEAHLRAVPLGQEFVVEGEAGGGEGWSLGGPCGEV